VSNTAFATSMLVDSVNADNMNAQKAPPPNASVTMQAIAQLLSQQQQHQKQQHSSTSTSRSNSGSFSGNLVHSGSSAFLPIAQTLSEVNSRTQPSVTRQRNLIPLSLNSDKNSLSDYQCLLREQMCLFVATEADLEASAQGRNRPIIEGQVGVVCKHCAYLPPGQRGRGAVYFPARMGTLYQAAQNMALNHFNSGCKSIPESTRSRLMMLKEKKPFVIARGTKQYWINTAKIMGLSENGENGLKLDSPAPGVPAAAARAPHV